jgi:acetaldehyde dehydrogenase (acetylating)
LGKLLILPNWTVNPSCVGQTAQKIARMAGFQIRAAAPIICAEIGGVGKEYPLSAEKLCPVLSLHFVKDFKAALDTCHALLKFGGLGHTAVIHGRDEGRIREFGLRVPAMRVLVNTSAPQGSTGITTNLFPAMTLGCGAAAGNATSDNIGPLNLINIKRIAWQVRRPEEAFERDGSGAPDRATVVAAVERYLAARGVTAPVPEMPKAAEVVDRFLARRAAAPVPQASSGAPAPAAAPPPAALEPLDFVCEADVRAAIRENRKLYIGAKTIVTPSARDLAEPSDILVMLGTEGPR